MIRGYDSHKSNFLPLLKTACVKKRHSHIRRPRQTQGGARQGIRHSTFRVEMQQQQQQQQQEQEQESADPGRRKGERARE